MPATCVVALGSSAGLLAIYCRIDEVSRKSCRGEDTVSRGADNLPSFFIFFVRQFFFLRIELASG